MVRMMSRGKLQERGFTITELMVVVVIVGILAAIAIYSVRKYIYQSRSTEALSMIQSIRAAEERWRAENLTYLNVSRGNFNWYPRAPGGKIESPFWNDAAPDYPRWVLLNPTASEYVEMGYVVDAGGPADPPPPAALPAAGPTGLAGNLTDHWYLIQALADSDDDGDQALYMAYSGSPEVIQYNRGE